MRPSYVPPSLACKDGAGNIYLAELRVNRITRLKRCHYTISAGARDPAGKPAKLIRRMSGYGTEAGAVMTAGPLSGDPRGPAQKTIAVDSAKPNVTPDSDGYWVRKK